jgi:hypothetical protein
VVSWLMSMAAYITGLEHDPYWQATAEGEDGQRIAIMRGHRGGHFDNGYHLYGNSRYNGLIAYAAQTIEHLFASGELTLIQGSIPK